ncbi:hypothetical protein LP420_30050 [Massilia sp. B-10]|nr:hypothetical protein LP420_30050 [Massilia sp. B-10]UUZ53100.1 hypothetical protein LP419_29620 [Massilia sp. H-1]
MAKDEAQALSWYDKAAKRGDVFAQVRIAELYQRLKQDGKAQAAFALANAPAPPMMTEGWRTSTRKRATGCAPSRSICGGWHWPRRSRAKNPKTCSTC